MKTVGSLVALGLALGMFACSHSDTDTAGAQSAQNTQSAQSQSSAVSCPLAQLSGVSAVEVDTREGIDVTFSGPREDVGDLQRDVHAMKENNDSRGTTFAACPCAYRESGLAENQPGQNLNNGENRWHGAAAGNTSMQGSGTVAADAKVEDISTGAILRLRARDKSQIQPLRDEIRSEIRSMRDYGCMGAL